jgi:hypothetical protein
MREPHRPVLFGSTELVLDGGEEGNLEGTTQLDALDPGIVSAPGLE